MKIIKLKSENVKRINLLPFHAIGVSKYSRFKRQYMMNGTASPDAEKMIELKEFFSDTGIPVKIGG